MRWGNHGKAVVRMCWDGMLTGSYKKQFKAKDVYTENKDDMVREAVCIGGT